MLDIPIALEALFPNGVDGSSFNGPVGDYAGLTWPGSGPTKPTLLELQAAFDIEVVVLARAAVKSAIDIERDERIALPILSETFQVDAGTLSSGAMANSLFAYDGQAMQVSSITRSGSIATAVYAGNHHHDDGQRVTYSGAGEGGYNIEAAVTVVDKKIVTFAVSGTPDTPATGTITAVIADQQWIDAQNNMVFWTASTFKSIHRDATKYLHDCSMNARDLKDQVLAATTVAEVDAIDINSGWPETGI